MKKTILALSIFLFTQVAFSFDGSRKGFIVGIGGGVAKNNTNLWLLGEESDLQLVDSSGIFSSFRLGGGLTDQFTVLYINNVSWVKNTSEVDVNLAVTGVASQYFLKPGTNTPYVIAGGGLASYSKRGSFDLGDQYAGLGYLFGVGYELQKYVSIEATYNNTMELKNSETPLDSVGVQGNAIGLTLNFVWY